MAETTIEWTDTVWNPVRGCTKVSPGCARCYAEVIAERFRGVKGHPYEQGFDLRLVPEKLTEPLSWKKPRRVFVNSMSDLFQEGVPDEFIDQVFAVMALTPQHTYQVLTKRAERIRGYFTDDRRQRVIGAGERIRPSRPPQHWYHISDWSCHTNPWPLSNVWLGVSVENQHCADERIPLLLQTPAAVRFLSCEPLLEGLDLAKHRPGALGLHWVIVGGESGPGARPCETWWIENIVGQCRDANVAPFVKQVGSVPLVEAARLRFWDWRSVDRPENKLFTEHAPGKWRVHLNSRKGGDMAEWPEYLRVREYPQSAALVAEVGHVTGPR